MPASSIPGQSLLDFNCRFLAEDLKPHYFAMFALRSCAAPSIVKERLPDEKAFALTTPGKVRCIPMSRNDGRGSPSRVT
jgi:hypothetical protein